MQSRREDHAASSWAVVLAGGEGSRLHSLTRHLDGSTVPKQFCSLQGGPCLLEDALQRASAVAPFRRVCTVVAAQHRRWWEGLFTDLPDRNVIIQSHNRGTAHGILLALLHIVSRDPDAKIVLLPADHYLRDEETMEHSLRHAAELARTNDRAVYLLGIEPEGPDVEYGYIVPARRRCQGAPSDVLQFVEKPSSARANALLNQGALWNSFIIAGSVGALLRLFGDSFSPAIGAISHLIEHRIDSDRAAIDRLYERLPTVDFSRDVLEGREQLLQVLPVPRCGWTDLGTPHRLGLTLNGLHEDRSRLSQPVRDSSFLNLAEQYARCDRSATHLAL